MVARVIYQMPPRTASHVTGSAMWREQMYANEKGTSGPNSSALWLLILVHEIQVLATERWIVGRVKALTIPTRRVG
jgi:hypothetical protein